MKMFLLGALAMYFVSSIVAIILDHFDIVDIWDFSEVYFQFWTIPIMAPFIFIHDTYGFLKRYNKEMLIYLIKHGVNPLGKTKQIDKLGNNELKFIVANTPQNSAVHFYAVQLLNERGER